MDHERNPNQLSHTAWPGQPPTEMPNTAYEFSTPKPGPAFPYSSGRHDSLHHKQLNHLENLARNDLYKGPNYMELKSDAMTPVNPALNCKAEIKSEPTDSRHGAERSNSSLKRIICGVCNMEVPEAKFDDHRYAVHLGLARPYGMSQEFSDSEKRRELKKSIATEETSVVPVLPPDFYLNSGISISPIALPG